MAEEIKTIAYGYMNSIAKNKRDTLEATEKLKQIKETGLTEAYSYHDRDNYIFIKGFYHNSGTMIVTREDDSPITKIKRLGSHPKIFIPNEEIINIPYLAEKKNKKIKKIAYITGNKEGIEKAKLDLEKIVRSIWEIK
jgi:hypothetical protein